VENVGANEVIRFPDVLVFLMQGEASAGAEGSVINHVAFRVQAIAKLEAQGMKVTHLAEFPGVASVYSPEGERIELFDDGIATNMGFAADPGRGTGVSERHNRKITVPIIAHHIHLYVPEGQVAAAQAWYARLFGGVTGKRWRYDAVDLPGINLNFSAAPASPASSAKLAPTKGRRLDHIGFEVQNLEAFCKRLEAEGVPFDERYTRRPSGIAVAYLTDPWGTYIELTEGLRGR
jgi:catechol 2,3-dioxygenase-like lactoylglutathione lyase family enzyme